MSEKNEHPINDSWPNWEKDFDLEEFDKKLDKELDMKEADHLLAAVTGYVRRNYGVKNALLFYIDYVQPIKEHLEQLEQLRNDSSHTD
jgi:hypothetical protein